MKKTITAITLALLLSTQAYSKTASDGYKHFVKGNVQEAVIIWGELARSKRDPISAFYLGRVYQKGFDSVEKDLEIAAVMFRVGAKYGYKPAMIELARMFETGIGLKKKPERAFALYKMAGEEDKAMEIWPELSTYQKKVAAAIIKQSPDYIQSNYQKLK